MEKIQKKLTTVFITLGHTQHCYLRACWPARANPVLRKGEALSTLPLSFQQGF
jgi:hypothetical protein